VSQRERWIIYPLLFFCFSMCIKLYWYPEHRDIKAKSVTTRALVIEDERERQLVVAGGSNGDGVLRIFGAPPEGAAGLAMLQAVHLGVAPNRRGVVITYSDIGQPMVELASNDRGGALVLLDAIGRREMVLRLPQLDPNNPRTAPVPPPVPPPEPAIAAPPPAVGTSAT